MKPFLRVAISVLLLSHCKPGEAIPTPPQTHVTAVSAAAFSGYTKQPGKLVVIDFYADWCAPCKALSPVLEKLSEEYAAKVKVGRVNVETAGQLANRLHVRPLPDVRFYRDGQQVAQLTGKVTEAELRNNLNIYSRDL